MKLPAATPSVSATLNVTPFTVSFFTFLCGGGSSSFIHSDSATTVFNSLTEKAAASKLVPFILLAGYAMQATVPLESQEKSEQTAVYALHELSGFQRLVWLGFFRHKTSARE